MTSRRWPALSARVAVPVAVAVLQALVVLGPALGRGVVVTYDMPWSPDPRWTPFVLGLDTPAPRAVPSDAVAVLLGRVLGASAAQHLVLLAILVALALGVVALVTELVPRAGTPAMCVAAVAAVWNPFVSERLFVGQWVVVLGLAVLPWALRSALRLVRGHPSSYAVPLTIALGSVGGVNSLLLVSGAVLVVLATGAAVDRSWRIARAALVALAVTAGGAAAWALPSLSAPPSTDASGARAFAPVADSPLGLAGSLVSGGAFWNTAAHPVPRAQLLVAVLAAVLSLAGVAAALLAVRGTRRWCLAAVLVVFGLLVSLSIAPGAERLWIDVVTGVPGGGALRDSQKLLAVWVVVAATGLGVLADVARRRLPAGVLAPAVGLLVGLPVVLSPQLVWGIGGRLDAVPVPADYRAAVRSIHALPEGQVGLLPWNQYRRYDWNESRVSLTLGPRIIDRVVLFDDSLPLRSGVVPGESRAAADVSARIADGQRPEEAVAGSGVRYVAAELAAAPPVDIALLRSLGTVVVDEAHLLVVDVGGPPEGASWSRTHAVGWGVTLLTWLTVAMWAGAAGWRRMLPTGLLGFRA